MQKFAAVAQDNAGNALANPTITVSLAGTATAASIFSTNTFTVLANPFTGNTDGTYDFYAGDGHYDITIAKAGYTFTAAITTDLVLTDPFSTLTPTQLTVSTNDYAPSNGAQCNIWRISSSGAVNITGIAAPITLQAQYLTLVNVGTQTISITNQDALSIAANRVITGTAGTVAVAGDVSMTLLYDVTTTRWRKIV